ncbi:glycoside hydrolase family 2 TIM barrel-domain containing protein [Hymenobacter sp. B81]|uniref:glycoside hydrolase family 2 TIM barrel-domain containing protein n=1 Tax=Hymenobacter sp. B81 TaxID=3344878 RepID=UPI0037DCEF33
MKLNLPRSVVLSGLADWVVGGLLGGLVACQRPLAEPPQPRPPAGVVPVKVEMRDGQARLLRGGQPYYIKGAGGLERLAAVRQAGGNSIRLWSTDYAETLLDDAQQQGLTVMLGIWLEREQEGFDYYDAAAVRRQKEHVREQVLRFRHHPALLMWNLGNELDLEATNPMVYEAVNDLARMVHELDPHHPVTTTLTGQLGMIRNIRAWCPELDVLSVNAYGSLQTLPADLRRLGWNKPYIVTEYGGKGWWESDRTSWNAPIEETSTQKAAFARQLYLTSVRADSARCLGAYVFYWGHKFELTDTWYSLFTRAGEKTALVDVVQELWSGRAPANRAPEMGGLLLNGKTAHGDLRLQAGRRYPALVVGTDPEADSLRVRWEVVPDKTPAEENLYKPRSTPPEPVAGSIEGAWGLQAQLVAPARPGRYRLHATLLDGQGGAATANLPFYVSP